MPPLIVGWDVETCPLPLDALTPRRQRRYELAVAAEQRRQPGLSPEEASRRARSLHPMLGWVCCVAAARLGPDGRPAPARTYTAAGPDEEPALLRAFWADLARLPRGVLFVTFNGKAFDCDWLRVRSAAHGLAPTRHDVLDRYPYNHRPHCDLARVFACACGLDDLCDLLGVPSPKPDPADAAAVTAETVADAVAAGRLDAVARYCEADVHAALACYARLRDLLP